MWSGVVTALYCSMHCGGNVIVTAQSAFISVKVVQSRHVAGNDGQRRASVTVTTVYHLLVLSVMLAAAAGGGAVLECIMLMYTYVSDLLCIRLSAALLLNERPAPYVIVAYGLQHTGAFCLAFTAAPGRLASSGYTSHGEVLAEDWRHSGEAVQRAVTRGTARASSSQKNMMIATDSAVTGGDIVA